jgi:phosphate ABC transporter, permease protein PstC
MKSTNTGGFAKTIDKTAQWLITVSGVAVIVAMIAMLVLIVREAAPLFAPASYKTSGAIKLPSDVDVDAVLGLGLEKDLQGRARVVWLLTSTGHLGYATLENGRQSGFAFIKLPDAPLDAKISKVQADSPNSYSVLWDNAVLSRYAMNATFADELTLEAKMSVAVELGRGGETPLFAMIRGSKEKFRSMALYADGTLSVQGVKAGKGLLAKKKTTPYETTAVLPSAGIVNNATLSGSGDSLYLGCANGTVISVDLSKIDSRGMQPEVTPVLQNRGAVTALAFLSGDYAIAVGDSMGNASVWFPRRENGEFRLRQSVGWTGTGKSVSALIPSPRDRGFFVLPDSGNARWLFSTTAKELSTIPMGAAPIRLAAVNTRGDALAIMHSNGELRFFDLDSSYPEAGWSGFFKRLLYEGHEKPAYVWQSTGSDASEPKFSLVPLIWGSVKGALYALVFATPVALLAALYLSQFAKPGWRTWLKPAVEMVAAVPSVVIGFIAALWLAPLLERCLQFFARHYHYDQRNSLVIAIAMGFAVIPTIFSLAEDAISAVPPSLSSASLALGASKWQTVWRVVLPTASPGIFTAVMLGLGRAVGETMIVLMATGNTPILSLSPFNGMRTLSANIAVEMPEAPAGGTLYRTLFLCALILFVMTLLINMAAELFRQRLRRRYGRL